LLPIQLFPEGLLIIKLKWAVCQVNLDTASTEVIRFYPKKIINISDHRIHSAEDAIEKLDAGASLVQLYTGFIYEGPALVKSINKRFWRLK
jgi:dihydroorotate dehydrogenase